MSFQTRIPAPILAIGVAIGLAIVGYGGGNVLALVSILFVELVGVELTPRRIFIISVITIQLIAFCSLSIAYLRYRGLSAADIGVRTPSLEGWIVLGVGFVSMIVLWLVGSIGSFIVGEWIGIEREPQMIFDIAQQDPFIFILLGVLSLLVVGPAEELLFRGIIQTRLRETFGAASSIAIATAIFALIHVGGFGSLEAGLLGVSVLFVVGLVLAISYEYTGNLVVVAIMHGLFNATQAALGYASVRFADPDAIVAVYDVLLSAAI